MVLFPNRSGRLETRRTPRNACGINPVDNGIYCITRGNNPDNLNDFFVRINCDFTGWSPGDDPVQGDVCWFGPSNSAQNPGGGVFRGGGRRCEDFFSV